MFSAASGLPSGGPFAPGDRIIHRKQRITPSVPSHSVISLVASAGVRLPQVEVAVGGLLMAHPQPRVASLQIQWDPQHRLAQVVGAPAHRIARHHHLHGEPLVAAPLAYPLAHDLVRKPRIGRGGTVIVVAALGTDHGQHGATCPG